MVPADLRRHKRPLREGYLQELRYILDKQDVSALVLFLKEMIPDDNPGSQWLKIALTVRADEDKEPLQRPALAHPGERTPQSFDPRPRPS